MRRVRQLSVLLAVIVTVAAPLSEGRAATGAAGRLYFQRGNYIYAANADGSNAYQVTRTSAGDADGRDLSALVWRATGCVEGLYPPEEQGGGQGDERGLPATGLDSRCRRARGAPWWCGSGRALKGAT